MTAARVRFGALGDIHADFDAVDAIMARHPDLPFWVSVGDVGDDAGHYRAPRAPLYFVKGNNEDFDVLADLAAGRQTIPHLVYLVNATTHEVGGLRVAALGGTFAPTWYEAAAPALPAAGEPAGPGRPRARDDKRRHFVRGEVEACAGMAGVDLLLTHEAPRPYLLEGRRGRFDAGKAPITAVLAGMRPRLHLFGHHHRFTEAVRTGVRSVGMDLVSRSYLVVDAGTMEYEVRRP